MDEGEGERIGAVMRFSLLFAVFLIMESWDIVRIQVWGLPPALLSALCIARAFCEWTSEDSEDRSIRIGRCLTGGGGAFRLREGTCGSGGLVHVA